MRIKNKVVARAYNCRSTYIDPRWKNINYPDFEIGDRVYRWNFAEAEGFTPNCLNRTKEKGIYSIIYYIGYGDCLNGSFNDEVSVLEYLVKPVRKNDFSLLEIVDVRLRLMEKPGRLSAHFWHL